MPFMVALFRLRVLGSLEFRVWGFEGALGFGFRSTTHSAKSAPRKRRPQNSLTAAFGVNRLLVCQNEAFIEGNELRF